MLTRFDLWHTATVGATSAAVVQQEPSRVSHRPVGIYRHGHGGPILESRFWRPKPELSWME